MIAYDVALTTVVMTDLGKPSIGSNEKKINNSTAVQINTWN